MSSGCSSSGTDSMVQMTSCPLLCSRMTGRLFLHLVQSRATWCCSKNLIPRFTSPPRGSTTQVFFRTRGFAPPSSCRCRLLISPLTVSPAPLVDAVDIFLGAIYVQVRPSLLAQVRDMAAVAAVVFPLSTSIVTGPDGLLSIAGTPRCPRQV